MRLSPGLRLVACSLALGWLGVLASHATAADPTITDLGAIPGAQYSYGIGLSADGSVVTGYSGVSPSFDSRAFRWTEATGMQALALLPGATQSVGRAVSGDGQTIVGSCDGYRATVWNADGITALGALPGRDGSQALGVNANGSVVVGLSIWPNAPRATRWMIGGGMQDLGLLPGAGPSDGSIAQSVTPDGQVVFGTAGLANREHAFRWTTADGMEDLGLGLPGYPDVTPARVSTDGTTLVGACRSVTSPQHSLAFRWTRATGMTGIPSPFGGESTAGGVNRDGTAVVGWNAGAGAFLWTPSLGMVRLSAYLRDQGVDMRGWGELQYAWDISPDGSSITGWGNTSQGDRAFLIRGLRLHPCPADFNGDGLVDFADYLEFLNFYDIQDARVDFNQDGLVDFSDYLEFLNLYDAGC